MEKKIHCLHLHSPIPCFVSCLYLKHRRRQGGNNLAAPEMNLHPLTTLVQSFNLKMASRGKERSWATPSNDNRAQKSNKAEKSRWELTPISPLQRQSKMSVADLQPQNPLYLQRSWQTKARNKSCLHQSSKVSVQVTPQSREVVRILVWSKSPAPTSPYNYTIPLLP